MEVGIVLLVIVTGLLYVDPGNWSPFVPPTGSEAAAGAEVMPSLLQDLALPAETWIRFLMWMALGVVCYFAYGHRRSKLAKGDEHEQARAAAAAGR